MHGLKSRTSATTSVAGNLEVMVNPATMSVNRNPAVTGLSNPAP